MKKIYFALLVLLSTVLISCGLNDNKPPLVSLYDLTFMLDEETVYHSFKVELDAPMLYPENPTKEGYTFNGWFVGETQYTETTVSASALTLYAKFTEISNTVTYLVRFYDSTTLIHSVQVEHNSTLAGHIPDTTKTNHTFNGWYTNSGLTVSFNTGTAVTSALDLYGKWTETDDTPPPDPGTYTGYYSSLDGLTGNAFKTQLETMIKTTGYATGSTAQVRDADFYQGSYYLIYTGFGSYGNREHVWPNSKLGNAPDYDLHNLRAANVSVNSTRSNYPFTTGSGSWKLSGNAFYPGDEHVGDVARIVLYISVRYNLNLNLVGNLNMFLTWHEQDPVSPFELSRNSKIQGIQNSRNPFIDHPELVYSIWPSSTTSYQTNEIPPTAIAYVPQLSFNNIFH